MINIEKAKELISKLSAEIDNDYIKSTLNIVSLRLDEMEKGDMNKDEFEAYRDRTVNYEIRNMTHIVPPLDDDKIAELNKLGELISSFEYED